MIEKEIYHKFSRGEISRDEALKLILRYTCDHRETQELSECQKGIWAFYNMFPDSYAYNTPGALILSSYVDVPVLKMALKYLSDYHPVLRTVFKFDQDKPYRVVKEKEKLVFKQFDADQLSEVELDKRIWEEVKQPFNIEDGPLMKVCLFNIQPNKKILLLNFHHIIFDGVSSQIFVSELKECYFAIKEGRRPELKERTAGYDDFVRSQQQYLKSRQAKKDREYWLSKLGDGIPTLELPTVTLEGKVQTEEGKAYSETLEKEWIEKLKGLNTSKPVTLFSIMLAAYMLLLSKYGKQKGIFVGTPLAGRNESRFEDVLGCFINTVVIKGEVLPGKTLETLIEEVHTTALEALSHGSYPYHMLVKEFNRLHKKGMQQLFQAAFYFQNWMRKETDGVFLDYVHDIHQIGEFNLTLEVIDTDEKCILHFKYNPEVFSDETIKKMTSDYRKILRQLTEGLDVGISEILFLTGEEKKKMQMDWNNTKTEYEKDKAFPELFIEQAKKTPDAIAVVFENQRLTYRELFTRSKKLAYYMQQKGVRKGSFVGIFLERSLDLLSALIATQMAGGVYIPLDPTYPADRLAHMFEQSDLTFLVSTSSLNERLPYFNRIIINLDVEAGNIENEISENELNSDKPLVRLQHDDLVYVIFTSGSTGKPKGIMVHHGGLANFLLSMAKTPGCTHEDRVFALTTICFDIAGLEMYLPLITGATVEILPDAIAKDGIRLLEKLESSDVSIMQATPATWQMLIAAGWNMKRNLKVLCGGEALSGELAERLLGLSSEVWNMYGPTETTIWSSVSKVERDSKISIGLPIANTTFYVLDENLQPVPTGVAGELYIGGDGVAKGYINKEEETAKRFLRDPFAKEEASFMYKTGDMVRYLEDGTMEYLGRTDFQVKINGFRIELGEIESMLQKVKGIREAVVVVRDENGDGKNLVAFLVAENANEVPSNNTIRGEIERSLPEYMIPSRYFFLKEYPMTLNRKVDRKELSNRGLSKLMENYGNVSKNESSQTTAKPVIEEPQKPVVEEPQKPVKPVLAAGADIKPVEAFLLSCISEIKHISKEEIGVNVNLGEFGFDSISFTSFSVKVNKYYNIKTNPTLFYTYQTVQSFAVYLTENYPVEIGSKSVLKEESRQSMNQDGNETKSETENVTKGEAKNETGNVLINKVKNEIKDEKLPSQVNIENDEQYKVYNDDIAIIGMSGILPGSENLNDFWRNILDGKDLISEIPSDRWDWRVYYNEPDGSSNKINSKWGGFISDVDKFDAEFFGISPREAELMDPQQRLMLQVVWSAIENAGYRPTDFSGTDMGVFVGATSTDYSEILLRETDVAAHTISGIVNAIIPNRISYLFNFHGPSELVDTACSSALVGLCRAVTAIRSGACETAIAGGVNLLISPFPYIALSKTNMLSQDGRCKAFDKSANGYVRGEGAAAIVLKPLSKAIESNDHIYAVIKGIAVNHGGKTNSLTAPNPNAQRELIKKALKDAGVDPTTIGYIETHGTGTPLGDPIEVNGLKMAYEDIYKQWNYKFGEKVHCGIGSVKTNIGHLEALAGLAGLIKVSMAAYNKKIPASIHLNELNPYISLENSPFYITKENQDWQELNDKNGNKTPLRGGVSSFGFGGTNAHVLVEEFPYKDSQLEEADCPEVIILSARNKAGLMEYANNLLKYLKASGEGLYRKSDVTLQKLAYTLQVGRDPFKERLAIIAASIEELTDRIEMFIEGNEQGDFIFTSSGRNITDTIGSVLDSEELQALVEQFASKGDLPKLSKLWVNGVNVDWSTLYGSRKPGRIPLPTYPFDKVRYWIPKRSDNHKYGRKSDKQPLVDRVVPEKSIKQGLVFQKVLRKSDLIVKDHVVNSQCVFPGTGYLEILAEAATFLIKDKQFRISNVIWQQPLIVEDDRPVEVNILLAEDGEGYRFEIESIDDGRNKIHSKGSITFETARRGRIDKYVSINDIKQRCREVRGKKDFYQWLAREAGIEYGGYFQGIEEIMTSDTEALGHIRISAEYEAEQGEYHIHPVIMDCALQSMACLLGRGPDQGKTKVPFSVEEVRVVEPLRAGEYYAHVVNVEKDVHNISLLDKDGRVCVEFCRLTSREKKVPQNRYFYHPGWVESANKVIESIPKEEKNILLLYHADSALVKEGLKRELRGCNIVEGEIGSETLKKSSNEWRIGLQDTEAYQRCVEENRIEKVYFLTGIVKENLASVDMEGFDERQKYGIYSFLKLVKALSQVQREIKLIAVTNHIFEVLPGEKVVPVNAGLSGFAKAAALECPHVSLLLADIEYSAYSSSIQLESVVSDLVIRTRSGQAGEAALRNGKWYERKFTSVALSTAVETGFKEAGVYLIAGLGGIGFELGLYLSRKYKARLTFVGRSDLDDSRMKKLEMIKAEGGQVEYTQGDITDPESVRKVVAGMKLKYGAINGVVHSAMVLKDTRIENMSEDVLREVAKPKVQGSVALFDVIKNEPIDFLMFFSSANALIGNAGQANYNAACSFQDSFASYIRIKVNFPVKVINWSFWGSVGAVASEENRMKMGQRGILSIEPSEGMKVIENMLASPLPQLVMFKATQNLLDSLGFDYKTSIQYYSQSIPSVMGSINLKAQPDDDKEAAINTLQEGFDKLEELGVNLVLEYFHKYNYFKRAGETYDKNRLMNGLGIIPLYSRLFDSLLDMLEGYGLLKCSNEMVVTTKLVESEALLSKMKVLEDAKNDLKAGYPTLSPYIDLVWTCVSNYHEVLSGKIDYTGVMFPGGSKDLVQSIYKGNVVIDFYNELVAETVKEYLQNRFEKEPQCQVSILEIGAGTGGTSAFVLNKIQDMKEHLTYYYTDISASFASYGEKQYGRSYPFAEFKVLDIEKAPEGQEFSADSIDLVLATNVLHATNSIENTLKNIKSILRNKGVVVINEITRFQNFSTLTFGLTGGWWNYTDDCRIKGSPLLTQASWREQLLNNGFWHIEMAGLPDKRGDYTQSVMIAESDGRVTKEVTIIPESPAPEYKPSSAAPRALAQRYVPRTVETRKVSVKTEISQELLSAETKRYVKDKIAAALRIDKNKIENDVLFDKIGVDSLIIIELNKEFAKDFKKLPSTLLFEYTTVDSLSGYFIKEHKEALRSMFEVQEEEVIEEVVEEFIDYDSEQDDPRLEEVAEMQNDTVQQAEVVIKEKGESRPLLMKRSDIAIIGISGRYPLSENLDEYWENLKNGRNCISEIPEDRWDWRIFYDPSNSKHGMGYSKWGGFIKDVDKFDADFFEISKEQACEMDPQERLFMETAWSALEDAGYPGKALSKRGDKVGVFVGTMYGAYGQIATGAWEKGKRTNAQSAYWIIPNRVSYYFDFTGPSIAIDTACSSSLTAIHYACTSIERGECNVAIAGGINLIIHPRQHVRLANLNNLAKTDRNKSFSEDADGFAEGEGVGAVLLKPLEDAIRDKDYIYGVIKGSAINSGGESSSFTAPSISAQAELIERAILDSGINPETVGYIEAHATGTVLGDPIEISALNKVFSKYTGKKHFCTIGSVKSNIGHLEAASGISALTKVLLQMRYGKLVPSININNVNPFIQFDNSPFYIQQELTDWNRNSQIEEGRKTVLPRRAGISSFGAGGANAHIILEEYLNNSMMQNESAGTLLFVLSAKNENSLKGNAKQLLNYLRKMKESGEKERSMSDIAYTLQAGRAPMEVRLAITASGRDELIEKLQGFCDGHEGLAGVYRGKALKQNSKEVCNEPADIERIAQLWIQGTSYNWEILYRRKPNRIPLPTYCFDKKRYWLESEEMSEAGYVFSDIYEYDEPYVRAHKSFGERTLLGMTYCSMAYQALLKKGMNGQISHFRNFLFSKPIVLEQGEKAEVNIDLVNEEGKLFIESKSRKTNSGYFETAARGEVITGEAVRKYSLEVPSFNDKRTIAGEDLYQLKPNVYEAPLYIVKEAFTMGNEVWGRLSLTEEIKNNMHNYTIHPALLDGAILCRLALAQHKELDSLVPLMIKDLYIFEGLPDTCCCRLKEVKTNSEIWEGDVEFVDESGKVLVLMKGIVCKKVWLDDRDPLRKRLIDSRIETEVPKEQTGDALVNATRAYLADKIAVMLDTSSSTIDMERNIMTMGIESSSLISLSKGIQDELKIELYPTLFFEYQSIAELAEYFAGNHADKISNRLGDCKINEPENESVQAGSGRTSRLTYEIAEKAQVRIPMEEIQKEEIHAHQASGNLTYQNEPVAIIGIAGVMPQCDDLEDFWRKIISSQDLVTEIPKDRWDWREYYRESPDDNDKTKVIWGGFMKEVDKFDPGFFGLSPREARLMDPQQRIVLELAWKAIEDAGYDPRKLSGSKTAVFVGVAGHDYSDILSQTVVESRSQALTGNAHNVLTGRVSYLLNLQGPSEPVDNACASSLVAIHRAVKCIQTGDCELAIAGGINVMVSPSLYISFDNVGILSPDGKCKTFDKSADGTVRGEGAGLVLLKPLNKAIEDKDHIYAVIRGSAINHGGHASSMTAPNPKQQAEVIVQAFENGGVDPETVSYIEAHGTGTSLGDPVEINGLKSAFKKLYSKWNKGGFTKKQCAIGAVKTNIGHLETAAGIAGIIKILLSMKHGMLPGLVNFKDLNPYIQLEDSPFYLVEKTQTWDRLKDKNGKELPYRAGVSSFGFSGVNAHIILEEYMNPEPEEGIQKEEIIVLSAQNEARLLEYAGALREYLRKQLSSEAFCITTSEKSGFTGEIAQLVAGIANISTNDVDEYSPLLEYGFDQIKLSLLVDKINRLYHTSIGLSAFGIEACPADIAKLLPGGGTSHLSQGLSLDSSSNKGGGISLRQIAYTLQNGRTAMEERLAVIANSAEELLDKLEKFTSGNQNVHRLYRGNIRVQKELTTDGELDKIACQWVSGKDFKELGYLTHDVIPNKVPLPTYPFERKKFWVSKGETQEKTRMAKGTSTLTALIDSNVSTLEKQCFMKEFTEEEFFLKDHVVNGTRILPGVVYIEMARMAGELGCPQGKVAEVRNIVWAKPLKVQGGSCEAFVTLYNEEDSVGYQISDADGKIFSQGSLVYRDIQKEEGKYIDLQAIRNRCSESLVHNEFYKLFTMAGFDYGTSFKPIEKIFFNQHEALSEIKVCEGLKSSFDAFVLHPVLLEGTLQTAGYLVNKDIEPTSPYIPFTLGAVEILGALPEKCFVYATFSSDDSDSATKKMNAFVLDQSGNVLLKVKNYMVRPMIKENKVIAAGSESQRKSVPEFTDNDNALIFERFRDDMTVEIAKIVEAEENQISRTELLERYGIDSVIMSEMANRLNAKFGLDITPAVFFEVAELTINNFTSYLFDKKKDKVLSHYAALVRPKEALSIKEDSYDDEETFLISRRVTRQFTVSDNKGSTASSGYEPIAVIGMSGRMPQSDNLDEFWSNLLANRDMITEVPGDRFDWKKYYGDPIKEVNKTNSKWGGFMKGVDKFDASFFNISPTEAMLMDPQQRIFFESVWEAIEDAGYKASDLYGSNTGVYLGVSNLDYSDVLHNSRVEALTMTGNNHPMIVNKISYFLNLSGPSEPIDTLCSSSLVSIHRAIDDIHNGICDMAFAGGINVILSPKLYISYGNASMLSPDGRCKTFDKSANGFVRGEGVGVLLLKPLNKALADNDNIYAVIRGSAVNHCGHSKSLTSPNPLAQAEVIKKAFDKAGFDPSTVSYIETHGTGTPLGDPVEINGLKTAFNDMYTKYNKKLPATPYCGLGSVKSNIGHLESAAGIAGVLKILLSMKNKTIPGNLHFNELNPYIQLNDSSFYITSRNKLWEPLKDENGMDIPRRAGISSFGAGGVNAHILFEEYNHKQAIPVNIPEVQAPCLFVLSAATQERLNTYAGLMVKYLENTGHSLVNIAYTSRVAREAMDERLAVVAATRGELLGKLREYMNGSMNGVFAGNVYDKDTLNFHGKKEEVYVKELMEAGNLSELMRCWVNGAKVDLEQLDGGRKLSKVDLPKYPFKKDRHWVAQSADIAPVASGIVQVTGGVLHPLVKANVSSLNQIKFVSAFNSSDFYVRDHVVNGHKMLPGVVYLEMARVIGELAGERKISEIRDVVWAKPVTVDDTESEVTVTLLPATNDPNLVNFEVKSTGNDGSQSIHCQGRILVGTGNEKPGKTLIPEEIKKRCHMEEDGENYYSRFERMGFSYGKSFRAVKRVYRGNNEVLALLELPQEVQGSRHDFVLHPSLLDGVLQASMIMGIHEQDDTPYLPYSLGSLQWQGTLPESCFAYITCVEERPAIKNTRKYTLCILDKAGNVLVAFNNFIKRAVSAPAKNASAFVNCRPKWCPEQITQTDVPLVGNLVVFGPSNAEVEVWRSKTGDQAKLVSVVPGESFQKFGDFAYCINPANYNDYELLLSGLNDIGIKPDYVVHSFALAQWNDGNNSSSFYSVFYLAKAMLKVMRTRTVKIMYLYLKGTDEAYVCNSSVNALLKSVMLENLNYKFVSVELQGLSGYVHNCVKELVGIQDEKVLREVRYDESTRFVKMLYEIDINPLQSKVAFTEGGVYLISGGTGGVGLHLCKYLLKQYKAKLVLFGRSTLTYEKIQKLNEYRAFGGELVYIQGDVSSKDDVRSAVNEAKRKFGVLNGVLHLAGVIKDSYIIGKAEEQIKEVFAPKIDGTLNLDEFTKDLQLDFFVLFSSISGVIGNGGQSDYSYANSFMDNFAHYREQLRKEGKRYGASLSINWPLWEEGGMSIDSRVKDAMMMKTGMGSIDTPVAFDILEKGIGSDENNFMVLAGDTQKIKSVFNIESKNDDVEKIDVKEIDTKQAKTQGKANSERLGELATGLLKEVISRVNNIPVENIREKVPLEKYGIDSILILKLSSELEEYFGPLSKSLFFEYQNIFELSKYFVENYEEKLVSIFKLEAEEGSQNIGENESIQSIENNESIPSISNNLNIEENIAVIEIKKEEDINETYRMGVEVIEKESATFKSSDTFKDGIAIVGISGRYPMSETLDEFWENLKNGTNCITEIPKERWNGDMYYSSDKEELGKSYSKWGGFIKDVDKFDPLFFNISPAEAEMMDPQERIFLETVWAALEDAGYTRERLGSDVGVFVGSMYKHYPWVARETDMGSLLSSTSYWAIANRTSYVFNFQGPSLAIDTACSSSLTAIHLACESIKRGECSAAIAGGINLSIHPDKYVGLSQTRMIGSNDRSKSFGDGDGYIMGEGVGAVLLKPLSKAVNDGDMIYGVIRHSLSNHGGKTNGFAVPNPNAQADLVSKLITGSGIPVETISYIESAANGSLLGDMIEVNALIKAFKQLTKGNGKFPMGTVKANIGHLEAASGISQLTKVLLQMKHKTLVPTISADPANPNISLNGSPLYIQKELSNWNTSIGAPRRALVSSFGAGGANTSLIIEEYVDTSAAINKKEQWPLMFVLSAQNEERLKAVVGGMYQYLQIDDGINFRDVAYTLSGKEWMPSRLAVIGESREDIMDKLKAYFEGGVKQDGIFYGFVDEEMLFSNKSIAYSPELYSDLSNLAQAWVNGVALDFEKLPQSSSCRRVSLPTYPFARERYWITDLVPELQVMASAPTVASASPVVQEKSPEYDVQNTLLEIMSGIARIPADRINPNDPFGKYGFDSLSGMRFINGIKEKYGKKIPVSAFFENSTISKLSDYLIKQGIAKEKRNDIYIEPVQKTEKEVFEMILRGVKAGVYSPKEAVELQRKLIKNEIVG